MAALDRIERRFWGDIWAAVPPAVASERGIELERFGPVQASIVADLQQARMLNLVLGATEAGAVEEGHLAAALAWVESRGVECYVQVPSGGPESEAVESWLGERGYRPGYGWMRFVRDPHPPRFAEPPGVEIRELDGEGDGAFGMIAATGFGLPAWASALFAGLPGRSGWRCYVASVEGTDAACAAMFLDRGIAELGVAATLEPARGRGCQLALLRQRIVDAAACGCHTLFVETGERIPERPSASYRNILRAGFEESHVCPNWQRPT